MKKGIAIFSLFCIVFSSHAQKVFPYLNNQDYFKSFHEGQSIQLDFLKPQAYKYSEDIVVYKNSRGDLYVFDGTKKQKLTGYANDYKIGRNLVAWNEGPIVNVWNNGKMRTLTQFGRRYAVSDSLVVFEDTKDNAVKVFYKGTIYDLYYSVSNLVFPQDIGSNTVAFIGNGNVSYAFIAGKIVEIGVLGNSVKFSAGGNLVAFNDTHNQNFAVAFKDGVYNIEPITVENYKTGYGVIAYIDQNNNLKAYINGDFVDLSSYASFYKVFRNMIVWGENGTLYAYSNGQKTEIANYIPKEYKIRDGIVAFRNLNGGVSVFYQNTVEIISNLQDAAFEVNGNTVKVQVTPGNYIFFKNGYKYSI